MFGVRRVDGLAKLRDLMRCVPCPIVDSCTDSGHYTHIRRWLKMDSTQRFAVLATDLKSGACVGLAVGRKIDTAVWSESSEAFPTAMVYLVYVLPSFRRKGVGRLLLGALDGDAVVPAEQESRRAFLRRVFPDGKFVNQRSLEDGVGGRAEVLATSGLSDAQMFVFNARSQVGANAD